MEINQKSCKKCVPLTADLSMVMCKGQDAVLVYKRSVECVVGPGMDRCRPVMPLVMIKYDSKKPKKQHRQRTRPDSDIYTRMLVS